ncbi:ADR386Wp [Eremothecium gossypii ATCC 10895]|uniref:ADR386Wp n=1 Tax=Eremothecium gossypii (strain ATCC 10895 / CBS 109.51 / FGSC 9923 / NRRL Y-1056) TaxID=284811 RepID=Q758Z1_EREGS|nr:ADR386Wp [Eremothecium gossypii ATCC 10895]AAS52306.1 ADR386Wp [Eremothecium gossypii ATCC 10895]AEY96603.1 FADR386Wp [Eremothecium gossypii FDAG1]
MALADSRPVTITTVESEVIRNSKSPIFHANYLNEGRDEELVHGSDSSNSPSSSIDDDSDSQSPKSLTELASKPKSLSSTSLTSSSSSVAISKIVPVTGERPKPKNNEPPLDDEVLHAVFVILWEKDPQQHGMTVKQLCDLLVERHPEMANLSTKLSNLVSAKLNAYVKKVEKGEKALTYALSREWSDASPRRMVYVYRGILAPEYQQMAQAASAKQKAKQYSASPKQKKAPGSSSINAKSNQQMENNQTHPQGLELNSTLVDAKNAGNFTRTLAVNNNTFSNGIYGNSELNIPYSTSPVSLGLTSNVSMSNSAGSGHAINEGGKRAPGTLDEPLSKRPKKDGPVHMVSTGRVAQSRSYNPPPSAPQQSYVTAAAAAPRLSKLLPTRGTATPTSASSSAQSPSSFNAATLIADIHKAVIAQSPIIMKMDPQDRGNDLNTWLKTIRGGFLTEEIDSPESVTVDELDEMFD